MGFTSDRVSSGNGSRSLMSDLMAARSALNSAGASAGVSVNNHTVTGIPAVHAAVEAAAEAVAQLTMGVWTGSRRSPTPADTSWQAAHFALKPNPQQDEFRFWHTLEASLDYRNNGYVWKTKGTKGQLLTRTALHPDQVVPFRGRFGEERYKVYFLDGYPVPPDVSGFGSVDVGTDVVLHVRGRGGIGELEAPSPIQQFQTSLGLMVAKQTHEASLWRNSARHGLAVEFPATTKKADADVWREAWDNKHAGPSNSGTTKVIGGGAKIVPISMTQADAQFAESVELSLRDACLIFSVPDWMLFGGMKGSSKPVSPEHDMQRWSYYGLGPRLRRIESAFDGDQDYFADTKYFCLFDTTNVVRGDLTTEDTVAHQQIQDGRLLPDEWRIERGREPLPGGVGMIPQITPVGGAPNKKLTTPADSDEDNQ